MALLDIAKDNILGALIGGAIVWFFPNLMSLNLFIIYVPATILGYISKGLSLILGAIIGGAIYSIIMKSRKK